MSKLVRLVRRFITTAKEDSSGHIVGLLDSLGHHATKVKNMSEDFEVEVLPERDHLIIKFTPKASSNYGKFIYGLLYDSHVTEELAEIVTSGTAKTPTK